MMKGKAKEQFNDESRWEELFKDLPFQRAAKAEEVADLTTFLVSPRCDYISEWQLINSHERTFLCSCS